MTQTNLIRWPIRVLGIGLVAAALALAAARASSSPPQLIQLGAQQASTAQGVGTASDIQVSYIPAGFTLSNSDTATAPTGTEGATTVTYTLTSGNPRDASWKGTVYVQMLTSANGPFDLEARKATKPNGKDATVQGKPAIFGQDSSGRTGISGLEWLVAPSRLLAVVARGPVPESELQSVAEGVSVR